MIFSESSFNVTSPIGNREMIITGYEGPPIEEIIIPEEINGKPVTTIGESAFEDYYGNELADAPTLKRVIIPDSVTSIEPKAFKSCGLEEVVLSKSLEVISYEAFKNNKIKRIKFPDSLRGIFFQAFSNNHLEEIKFGSNLKKIGTNSFSNNNLSVLKLPEKLTELNIASLGNNPLKILVLTSDITKDLPIALGAGTRTAPPLHSIVSLKNFHTFGEEEFEQLSANFPDVTLYEVTNTPEKAMYFFKPLDRDYVETFIKITKTFS